MGTPDGMGILVILCFSLIPVLLLTAAFLLRNKNPALSKGLLIFGILASVPALLMLAVSLDSAIPKDGMIGLF